MPLWYKVTVSAPTSVKVKPSVRVEKQTPSSNVSILNIALIAICAGLLLYYIVLANGAAAGKYRLTSLNTQMTHYTDLRSSLISDRTATEDSQAAQQFAQRQLMVEAKNISYIFENGNVALGR